MASRQGDFALLLEHKVKKVQNPIDLDFIKVGFEITWSLKNVTVMT